MPIHPSIIEFFFIQDRYAVAEALPPIDESQDWSLLRGQEMNGYTILEFTRNWVTCDERDRIVAVRKLVYLCIIQGSAGADLLLAVPFLCKIEPIESHASVFNSVMLFCMSG